MSAGYSRSQSLVVVRLNLEKVTSKRCTVLLKSCITMQTENLLAYGKRVILKTTAFHPRLPVSIDIDVWTHEPPLAAGFASVIQ
jgi:hypothetical protein